MVGGSAIFSHPAVQQCFHIMDPVSFPKGLEYFHCAGVIVHCTICDSQVVVVVWPELRYGLVVVSVCNRLYTGHICGIENGRPDSVLYHALPVQEEIETDRPQPWIQAGPHVFITWHGRHRILSLVRVSDQSKLAVVFLFGRSQERIPVHHGIQHWPVFSGTP